LQESDHACNIAMMLLSLHLNFKLKIKILKFLPNPNAQFICSNSDVYSYTAMLI
jgi:hypothetical protein